MIIIGWSHFPTILNRNIIKRCKLCQVETSHTLTRIIKVFSIFFIPLVPYAAKYFIRCNSCHREEKISLYDKNQLLEKYQTVSMGAEARNALLEQGGHGEMPTNPEPYSLFMTFGIIVAVFIGLVLIFLLFYYIIGSANK